MRTETEATSAGGAMVGWPQLESAAVLFFASLGAGTTAALPSVELVPPPAIIQSTTAGVPVTSAPSAGPAVSELRQISGLTWDQLARLFGLNRRSLHYWASGAALSAANEEHLQRLLAVARKIDRGRGSETRAALLAVHGDDTAFDLLARGQYDQVVALLGGGASHRFIAPSLSDDAVRARKPSPPDAFIGDVQDNVQIKPGRLLASKPIRTSRRK